VPKHAVQLLAHRAEAALLRVNEAAPRQSAHAAILAVVLVLQSTMVLVDAVVPITILVPANFRLTRQGKVVVRVIKFAGTIDAIAKDTKTALLGGRRRARHGNTMIAVSGKT
jgi:hypothetical protein